MSNRYFRVSTSALGAATAVLLLTSSGVLAGNGNDPQNVDDSNFNPASQKFGHAHEPQVGDRTVDFWSGQATVNGQSYGYDMVGGDPSTGGTDTVGVDIVLIDLQVRGMWFRGSDALDPVLGSPLFQNGDYTSANAASTPGRGMGAGGSLSDGNTNAQLLDATMRAQFNAVGTGYHLYLDPSAVHKAVSITVPDSAGLAVMNGRHVVFAIVDPGWMQSTVEGLAASLHWLEPHRLALFLTNDVVLGTSPTACCLFGAHGVTDVTAEGSGSNGRQAVQTYVWSSWLTAGLFNPMTAWAMQDIYGLSHEVVEWASDPFLTNFVPNWKSRNAPQYGCSNLLETADPVAGWGFAVGSNTVIDAADPSYSAARPHGYGDGSYHASEQMLLPWFFGMSPNTVSQPSQGGSSGRYSFMGDLNPFPWFHQPAAGC